MESNPPQPPTPPEKPDAPAICPECGAAFTPFSQQCWLCGWKVGDPVRTVRAAQGAEKDNPFASAPARQLHWTFSLSTLFLWTALVAVVMGVIRIAPGLGIPLALFCLLASALTIRSASRAERKTGKPLTVFQKISVFLEKFVISIVIVIVGIVALISALFVICAAAFGAAQVLPSSQQAVAIFVGVIIGVLIVGFVLWELIQNYRSSRH